MYIQACPLKYKEHFPFFCAFFSDFGRFSINFCRYKSAKYRLGCVGSVLLYFMTRDANKTTLSFRSGLGLVYTKVTEQRTRKHGGGARGQTISNLEYIKKTKSRKNSPNTCNNRYVRRYVESLKMLLIQLYVTTSHFSHLGENVR